MNFKNIALICGVLCAFCFFAGRYSRAPEVVTKIQTVEVEKEVIKHETKYITIVKKPDGSQVTTIDQETNTDSTLHKDASSLVKVEYGSKINFTALAGLQPKLFSDGNTGPIVFGGLVTKQIIGPITGSLWGLSNLTFGVGLGFNY